MKISNKTNIYQTGGSLPKEFPTYVVRKSDEELYQSIKNGEFCYVLTARQMGKSSLRIRTMHRLTEEGYACSAIDITSIGTTNITADEWYFSLLDEICFDLNLETDLDQWWEEQEKLSPIFKFWKYLREKILKEITSNLVIFIDEIDSLLSLDKEKINSDDFFAAIRGVFNERTDSPDLQRLNVVIIGVATPLDLMNDLERTPFNIGKPIHLTYFKHAEAQPLLIGFEHIDTDRQELLKEILYWSGGQPYLTQKICSYIAENETKITDIKETVKQHVYNMFLHEKSDDNDYNLSNVNNRIINNKRYNVRMLSLYRKLLKGDKIVVNHTDYAQIYLKLSGIVREENGILVVANPIYLNKFNMEWVDKNMGLIDRPYAKDLQRWIQGGMDDASTALRGEVLSDALKWKNGRDDLSQLEMKFIEYSQNIETEEREKEMEAQFSLVLRKKNRILRAFLVILLVLFASTVSLSILLYINYKELNIAYDNLEMAKQRAEEAKLQAKIALNIEQEITQTYERIDQLQYFIDSLKLQGSQKDSLLAEYDETQKSLKALRRQKRTETSRINKTEQREPDMQQLEQSVSKMKQILFEETFNILVTYIENGEKHTVSLTENKISTIPAKNITDINIKFDSGDITTNQYYFTLSRNNSIIHKIFNKKPIPLNEGLADYTINNFQFEEGVYTLEIFEHRYSRSLKTFDFRLK